MKPCVSYRSLDEDPPCEHPVDRVVRIRVGRRDLDRVVLKTSQAIVDALGSKRRLWFRFERAADELRARREEAYFDAGVEQQAVTEAASDVKKRSRVVRKLGTKLARDALASGVSPDEAIAAAILAAWALVGAQRGLPFRALRCRGGSPHNRAGRQ